MCKQTNIWNAFQVQTIQINESMCESIQENIKLKMKTILLSLGFALYRKIGCCDSTSIDGLEMILYCRF